jgi:Tol biopolymer transport system component
MNRAVGWVGDPDQAISPAVSRDGRIMVYRDDKTKELALRDLHAGTVRQLTHLTEVGGEVSDEAIAVSADGRFAAFFGSQKSGSDGLFVASLSGGLPTQPRFVVENEDIAPIDWLPDDKALLVAINRVSQNRNQLTDIALLTIEDASLRTIATVGYWSVKGHISLAPNGAAVAYDEARSAADRQRDIKVMSVDGGRAVVVADGLNARLVGWSADSRQLIFIGSRAGRRGLWALPVVAGRPGGQPNLVASGFEGEPLGITTDGDLYYTRPRGPSQARLFIAPLNVDGSQPTSAPRMAGDPTQFSQFPLWSADSSSFMYVTSRADGPVITVSSAGGRSTKSTPLNLDYIRTFDWSPDRSQFVFCGGINTQGEGGVYLVDAASGNLRIVVQGEGGHPGGCHFSQDGRAMVAVRRQARHHSLVELAFATGEERVLQEDLDALLPWGGVGSTANRYPAGRSPDGRFLLAMTTNLPTSTLLAFDMTTGETREVFQVQQRNAFYHYGDLPWMPDGRSVIANVKASRSGDREMWWIPIDGRTARRIDLGVSGLADSAIAVRPDGKEIAFVAGHDVGGTIGLFPDPRWTGAGVEFRVLSGFLRPSSAAK